MQYDASRLDQVGVDEHLLLGAVQFHDLDHIALRVGPVDVSRDPVDSDALFRRRKSEELEELKEIVSESIVICNKSFVEENC